MKATSIAVVVVTHNRKSLLTDCVNAIVNQSYYFDKLYVVDNASTDGTYDSLASNEFFRDSRFQFIGLDRNIGGAGGFSVGLNVAIMDGHDWIWLMDDDCLPHKDALLELFVPIGSVDIRLGFVCSHVQWIDGAPHRMNIPGVRLFTAGTAFNSFISKNVLVIPSCSFVSVIVSSEAVKNCGLPLSEMFLWGDDLEFFRRLSHSGFLGFYAWKSIATHRTQRNINNNIFEADQSELSKHFFGIRNNLFIVRKNKGFFSYVLCFLENLTIVNLTLLIFRKSHRFLAFRINTVASISSLFFNPKALFPGKEK